MGYKIAHIADIQINAGLNQSDRFSEYSMVLDTAAKQIIANQVDALVIAGDVFERYNTTENERILYIDFIHKVLDGLKNCHIIVIDGNHDIRKRNFTFYDGNEESLQNHVLKEIHKAINSKRYHYSTNARLLRIDEMPGIIFACWSELARFDSRYGNVSPYKDIALDKVEELKRNNVLIDIYHGVLPGATDMGSSFELPVDDDVLLGHYCMAGHVHKYQVLNKNTAIYSSSLCQRTFNEGIRIIAGVDSSEFECEDGIATIYDYRNGHGIVYWDINEIDKSARASFKPIPQPVINLTIELTKNATQEQIAKILADFVNVKTNLKIVFDSVDASVLSYLYSYCSRHKNPTIKRVQNVYDNETKRVQESSATSKQVELTVDSLSEIAKNLVKPVIDSSYLANQELKDSALDYCLQVFRQELGYHLHPENHSEVVLHSVNISNFKTIHKAHINFAEHGLQAIRGQNGTGKTTCFEAINFALTGEHNETFKGNAKKQYYMRLFNDKEFDDNIVSVKLKLSVNKVLHEIHVMLERFLAPDATIDNWKQHCNKIVKTTEIYVDGKRTLSGDEAETWLRNLFGEYSEFAVLHSISQNTLESIKYMSNDNLARFILHRLGYSFLGKLEFYLQGCKDTEKQKYPKPSTRTATEVITANQAITESINAQKLELNTLKLKTIELFNEQTVNDNQISELSSKLKHIPENLITKWKSELTKYAMNFTDLEPESAYESISAKLVDTQKFYAGKQEQFNEQVKLKQEFDVIESEYSTTLNNFIQNVLEQLNSKRSELQNELDSLNSEHKRINNEIIDAEHTIETYQLQIQSNQAIIDSKTIMLEQCRKRIYDLEHNTCSFCGSSLIGKNIDISKQFAYEQETAKNLDNEISQLLEKNQLLTKEIEYFKVIADADSNHRKQLISISESIDNVNVTIGKINYSTQQLANSEYRNRLMELNCPELYTKYMNATNSINSIELIDLSSIMDKINALNDTKVMIANAIEAKRNINEYKQVIADNEELNKQITAIQEKNSKIQQESMNANVAMAKLEETIKRNEQIFDENKELLAKIIDWETKSVGFDAYSKLIKDLLPKYLYVNACRIINDYIVKQNLPSKLQPMVSETNYGAFLLRDRTSLGGDVYRSIQEASGMELTICGLLLCLAMHNSNQLTNFKFVMLDELSGKLSTGTLDDRTDYLKVFESLLKSASETTMISVIDHRLSSETFDSIVNIIKQEDSNLSITEDYLYNNDAEQVL